MACADCVLCVLLNAVAFSGVGKEKKHNKTKPQSVNAASDNYQEHSKQTDDQGEEEAKIQPTVTRKKREKEKKKGKDKKKKR